MLYKPAEVKNVRIGHKGTIVSADSCFMRQSVNEDYLYIDICTVQKDRGKNTVFRDTTLPL